MLSDKCQVLSDHNSPSKIDQWCKPKPAAKLVLALVRRSPLMLTPSKIDQWCKPKPAAKLVLALVRRSPLMLKERAEEFQNDINNSSDYD